jgi:hypothetical protein
MHDTVHPHPCVLRKPPPPQPWSSPCKEGVPLLVYITASTSSRAKGVTASPPSSTRRHTGKGVGGAQHHLRSSSSSSAVAAGGWGRHRCKPTHAWLLLLLLLLLLEACWVARLLLS